MRISKLEGIFSGKGFLEKKGRKIKSVDSGFIEGPVDIVVNDSNGTIQSIEQSSASFIQGEQVYSGEGCIATAGFVDSHTHTFFTGSRYPEYFMRWGGATYAELSKKGAGIVNTMRAVEGASDSDIKDSFAFSLNSMLLSGSTTVEVKSGYGATAADELRQLRLIKEALVSYGTLVPQLKQTFLGLHALPRGAKESAFVDSMISILPQVIEEKLAHFADAFPEKGFFTMKESLRFLDAAQKLGLGLKVHADEITCMKAAETFSERGALSVDHLQKISKKGIAAMAKRKSITVATLLPATSFFLGIEYAPARKLLNAGVPVALASDFNPGTAPHSSLLLTRYLAASQFKMTAAEIFCALTYNGAAALGMQNQTGVLLPGFAANFLLWATPPVKNSQGMLESILLSEQGPQSVFLAGHLVKKMAHC